MLISLILGLQIVASGASTDINWQNIKSITNKPPIPQVIIKKKYFNNSLFITLDGRKSFDPDGDKIKFFWIFQGKSYQNSLIKNIPFQEGYNHEVFLRVSDNYYNSSETRAVFQIEQINSNKVISKPSKSLSNRIKFNEIFPNPYGTDISKEWLELYNPTSDHVQLKNWRVFKKNNDFFLLSNYSIAPKSFLLVPLKNFSLPNQEAHLNLESDQSELIDEVSYKNAKENQAYMRAENNEWKWTKFLTPGKKNPAIIQIEGEINSLNIEKKSFFIDQREIFFPQINHNLAKMVFQETTIINASIEEIDQKFFLIDFEIIKSSTHPPPQNSNLSLKSILFSAFSLLLLFLKRR